MEQTGEKAPESGIESELVDVGPQRLTHLLALDIDNSSVLDHAVKRIVDELLSRNEVVAGHSNGMWSGPVRDDE